MINKINFSSFTNGRIVKFLAFSMALIFSFNVGAQDVIGFRSIGRVAYILNTFLFLVCGFLVMFMAAGFCMLEAGQVRSKNMSEYVSKNIGLFSMQVLCTTWSDII